MGLCEEKEYREKYPTQALDNEVFIRLDPRYMIQANIKTFPIFCKECKKVQPTLYVHYGSRYGQVGGCICKFCKNNIIVTDDDNIVLSIYVDKKEINFEDLYLLHWKYIEQMGAQEAERIKNRLQKFTNVFRDRFIPVNQLCDEIEDVLQVAPYNINAYSTDAEFSFLPDDINRWISLLEALEVKLPEYVQKMIK